MEVELFDAENSKFMTPAEYNWTIPYNPLERE